MSERGEPTEMEQIEHEVKVVEAEMNRHESEKIAADLKEIGEKTREASPWMSVVCALTIVLGSLSYGAAIGYPSPAMPDLDENRNVFHTTTAQDSWVGSILTLGALFGGLVSGPIMDILGRKMTMLIWALPSVIGWVLIFSAPSFGCLITGRVISGLCTGIYSVVCPVYIGEIAPPAIRGLLGSCHQMAVCLGILFAYGFGAFLTWQWLAVACEALVLVMICLVMFIPESPRWLLSVQKREEAIDSLHWLRGKDFDITHEIAELEVTIKESMDKASVREFLQPQLAKPLLITLGLMVFQQFSGVNVIMFYTVTIFNAAHLTMDPNVQTVIVGAVGVVGTFVSIFISDLTGRRILLIVSGFLMTLSMAGMGAYFYELVHNPDQSTLDSISWLPVTCLVIFNFGFNVAFGPIPWVLMSELFPLRAKAVASSVATAANWLCAFILTKFWDDMTNAMSDAGGYWFCAGFCAVSIPFVLFFVPETKGKTLEEIVASFQ